MMTKGYDTACCWCKPFVNLQLVGELLVPHNPSTQQKQPLWTKKAICTKEQQICFTCATMHKIFINFNHYITITSFYAKAYKAYMTIQIVHII